MIDATRDGDTTKIQRSLAIIDFMEYILSGQFKNYSERIVKNPEEPESLGSPDSMDFDSSQTITKEDD